MTYRLHIGNELDLNIKFQKGKELLGLYVDQNQPFYLKSEKYPEVEEELKQFFDSSGRFQFRWFKDFLLKEVNTAVIAVMEEQHKSGWGLKEKTPNSLFESDLHGCIECLEKR